ncbi:MAG: heme lyase CcmF/NrfE family subunit, partial [Parvularculaceae bacterium]|nr:heme lyase CcmF/NrfE family subunit [Parvularculaceae bacterium]
MTAEIGQVALILALLAAVYQGVFPMVGAATGDARLMSGARASALAQFLFVLAAFAALAVAHATDDFTVRNVVENSHTDKPFVYKLSGVWGNHEGSMALWVLILAGFGAAAAGARRIDALRARALAIQGLVAAAFLAFILFTSNPFARTFPPPPDGADLNPLLQDPGLAIHPPFLYLGYVGFSMVFAFAVAGLIGGRVDEAWARIVRPYALAAWTFLTIGIALGSWWAYYELGWGGFWAWDPVENASFMPWLAGTALIHSLRVTEVRGAFRAWTVLLAILAFSLSLIGTFLVRSGILTSVHAFAVDPERGVFILGILGAAIGGSLILYGLRAADLGEGARFGPVSREGGLLVNNMLTVASLATVFIGTFYPLFAEVATGAKISVGAPYFNAVYLPFAGLTLLVMAPAAMLAWKRGDLKRAIRQLWPAAAAAAVAGVLGLIAVAPKSIAAAAGVALAVFAGCGALLDFLRRVRVAEMGAAARLRALPRSYLAMTLAHFGLAVAAIGVVGAGAWKEEVVTYAKVGDVIRLGRIEATLASVETRDGPNYESEAATFRLMRGGRAIGEVVSERRFYPVRGMQTTEAGILTRAFGDLYFTIGEFKEDSGHVVRAWSHPFVIWMWIGAGLMAAGGAAAAGMFAR